MTKFKILMVIKPPYKRSHSAARSLSNIHFHFVFSAPLLLLLPVPIPKPGKGIPGTEDGNWEARLTPLAYPTVLLLWAGGLCLAPMRWLPSIYIGIVEIVTVTGIKDSVSAPWNLGVARKWVFVMSHWGCDHAYKTIILRTIFLVCLVATDYGEPTPACYQHHPLLFQG